jgi:peptidyl-prolyl cis-trans isomerase SDCCAG10
MYGESIVHSLLSKTSPSPPKIKTIRILDNPFPDIIPRITAAERREQQKARDQAQREREDAERRKGAKKYVDPCRFHATCC